MKPDHQTELFSAAGTGAPVSVTAGTSRQMLASFFGDFYGAVIELDFKQHDDAPWLPMHYNGDGLPVAINESIGDLAIGWLPRGGQLRARIVGGDDGGTTAITGYICEV